MKLDHEGVTAPKTKCGKALLAQRGGIGGGPTGVSRTEAYTHPVLLVEENRRDGRSGPPLLLRGTLANRRLSPPPLRREDCGPNWGQNCGSYSTLDEKQKRVDPQTSERYLSRLSGLSSSSSSCSSSSSGSFSSSSLCSSDNDSSWSSDEDEGSSTVLLRSCMPPQHALLPPPAPSVAFTGRTFIAKAVTMSSSSSSRSTSNPVGVNRKLLRRRELLLSLSSPPRELSKRPIYQEEDSYPPCPTLHPVKQSWEWVGTPTQRRGLKGRARKLFYKALVRGKEMVRVGDCAVFQSPGGQHSLQPKMPCVGLILALWESWSNNMVAKVRWFYHSQDPVALGATGQQETKHALYQSSHEDENDVQTISHKCQVLSRQEYERACRNRKSGDGGQEVFYLAGTYDPGSGQVITA